MIKGIYKLTSPSGKIYIGQSTNLESRLKSYKTAHCKKQVHLYNAILKYGFENFKIEILYSTEREFTHLNILLDTLEIAAIKKYNSTDKTLGYNIRSGGTNGKCSEETKQKMSISQKNRDRSTLSEKNRIKKSAEGKKKTILQFDKKGNYIKTWNGAVEIVNELGLSAGNISEVCYGKRKSTGGFIFKFKED